MLLQAKAESMRDAVKAAGEEEGSEDEELRKTVAVRDPSFSDREAVLILREQ